MTDRIQAWLKEKEALKALKESMDPVEYSEAQDKLLLEADSIFDALTKN